MWFEVNWNLEDEEKILVSVIKDADGEVVKLHKKFPTNGFALNWMMAASGSGNGAYWRIFVHTK